MKTLRLLSLLAVCCATSTSWAAEPAAAKPATPAAKPAADESAPPKADETTKAPQGSSQADEGTQEEDLAELPAAKPKPSGKGSPERFVPSEQVRADFDVSFPIDI